MAATNKLIISQSIYDQYPDVLPDTSTMYKKWIWKEDSNSLEQVNTGVQISTDRQLLAFSKNKKSNKNTTKRTNTNSNTHKKKTDGKGAATTSPSIKIHTTSEKRSITLQDVKSVSYDLMSEGGEMPDSFQESLRNNHFDAFLAVTLYYFDVFFQKIALETKPKTMNTEPSIAEKKASTLAMKKVELAKKFLAEKYCSLILGLETRERHHMACGSHRKSLTKRDRSFYETLYSYSCLVVWITFKRCHLDIIQSELGRLFRSDSFNPHREPVIKSDFKLASDLTSQEIHDVKLTPSSLHRNKRPPISSIINQRSPVLISLFPTSKDSASRLLDRRQPIPTNIRKESNDEELIVNIEQSTLSVGIIGEIISGFNPFTLAPFGDDGEDEEESEEEELNEGEQSSEGIDEKPKNVHLEQQDNISEFKS